MCHTPDRFWAWQASGRSTSSLLRAQTADRREGVPPDAVACDLPEYRMAEFVNEIKYTGLNTGHSSGTGRPLRELELR